MKTMCMLEENKICDDCLECNKCDLDPNKICNNCAKCIVTKDSYRSIVIDDIIYAEDIKKRLRLKETKLTRDNKG